VTKEEFAKIKAEIEGVRTAGTVSEVRIILQTISAIYQVLEGHVEKNNLEPPNPS
jgi:hypothetical protein